MNAYQATKNGETLKYLTSEGIATSETMKNIKSAIRYLENEKIAKSATTLEGWTVERMQ